MQICVDAKVPVQLTVTHTQTRIYIYTHKCTQWCERCVTSTDQAFLPFSSLNLFCRQHFLWLSFFSLSHTLCVSWKKKKKKKQRTTLLGLRPFSHVILLLCRFVRFSSWWRKSLSGCFLTPVEKSVVVCEFCVWIPQHLPKAPKV